MMIYTLVHPTHGSVEFRVTRSSGVRIATSDTKGSEMVRRRNMTYGSARSYWTKLMKYEGWRRLTDREQLATRWKF